MMRALYYEDPSTKKITDKKISETVRELRNNPDKGSIIIFQNENVIVGYSVLIPYWSNEYGGDILHVDELYVKPKHREHGIGTSFLRELVRMRKGRAVAIQLEVTPSNTGAMKYYKRLGFEKSRNYHLVRTI